MTVYAVSGTVTGASGSPSAQIIRAYRRDDGSFVAQVSSDSSGNFVMVTDYSGELDLLCLDDDAGSLENEKPHRVIPSASTAYAEPPDVSGLTLWVDGTYKEQMLTLSSAGYFIKADNEDAGLVISRGGLSRGVANITGSLAAKYKTFVVNGLPVLRFNGTDDTYLVYVTSGLATSGSPLLLSDLFTSTAKTMIVALKVSAADANQANSYNNDAFLCDASGYFGLFFDSSGSNLNARVYNYDGNSDYATQASALNEWKIYTVKHDGTNIKLRVNGGTWASTASGTTSVMTGQVRIARGYDNTRYLPCDLAHLATFNTAVSDADINKIEKWMGARLGIAVA